jgi:hypothetical protein
MNPTLRRRGSMNELAAVVPEAYESQKSKYLGREAVLDAPISPAGLLFNDKLRRALDHDRLPR